MNALILGVLIAAAPPTPGPTASSVYTLKGAAFAAQAKKDLATLRMFVSGLDRLEAQVQSRLPLFSKSEQRTYTPEEKQTLLTTWGAAEEPLWSVVPRGMFARVVHRDFHRRARAAAR